MSGGGGRPVTTKAWESGSAQLTVAVRDGGVDEALGFAQLPLAARDDEAKAEGGDARDGGGDEGSYN